MPKLCCAVLTAIVAWMGSYGSAVASGTTPGAPTKSAVRPSVTFLGSANNPPFLWADESGKPRGYTVTFMEALAREGGFDVKFIIVPRQMRRQEFRKGRGDVTGVQLDTAEAANTITLVPLWRMQELVVYRDEHRAPASLADLKGETVGVVEASNQHLALMSLPRDARPEVVTADSFTTVINKLRAGEVTVVYGHSLGLRTSRAFTQGSRLHSYEFRSAPIVLAARPERADLQPLFMGAYLRLVESGRLTEIIEKTVTLAEDAPQPSETEQIGRVVLMSLGIGGLVFCGMLVWSRSLQREVQRRTVELQRAAEGQKVQAHVLSQVTDAIVVADVNGCVTTWNTGAETIFGRPAAEVMGQSVASLITNRMAAPRDGDLHSALAAGSNWRGDAEIVRPSGDTVFVEATLRRLTDESGELSGTLIVAHDVDARRRAEIEAGIRARQQAAIASLGQRALAGIDFGWLIDQAMSMASSTLQVSAVAAFELKDGQLVMRAGDGWDSAAAGITTITADHSRYPGAALAAEGGVTILNSHDPGGPAVDAFHVREGMLAGVAVLIPGRSGPHGLLLAADRRPRRFSRDDVHFLQAIANVIGAAHERSSIDADLHAELALHNATLEAAADGILVTDVEGRVRRYNQRLVTMWGFPPDVLTNGDTTMWVRWGVDQLDDSSASCLDSFREAGRSVTVQSTVLRLKDGRVIDRHSQPQMLDGRVNGRVWCYRDVTDRVRAEEERRRLESQMQHVQKLESLGVLAGGIAHDFNNLLVGVLGHAGLALTEVPSDSPAYERIEQIQLTAQRAAELTNQMLAYSGKGRFVLQSADLSEIVGEMTHLLRTAVEKNADIMLDLDHGLPAFDGDPAQIRQVVMNLITNASDAIGNSPGTISIQTGRVSVTPDYVTDAWIGSDLPAGEYVFVEVRDTGCGMDSATLARIFDPFFTTKFTGRGLGLAAVLGIVRGHKGGIKISSEPGKGTTFRVLLPATSTPAASPALPVKTASVGVAGARVLVVDDEPGVRTIARESLRRAGFDVTTVNDGAEAIDLLGVDKDFQVVLLDMTMPRMNGTEAFRLIKELQPDLPVVLTSGYSAQEAVGRFGNDGIAGFIQKPFMPAALVKAMHDAISQGPRREVA
jgi:PAS domain S-box-containing protein